MAVPTFRRERAEEGETEEVEEVKNDVVGRKRRHHESRAAPTA
jgi:hypothetical protein